MEHLNGQCSVRSEFVWPFTYSRIGFSNGWFFKDLGRLSYIGVAAHKDQNIRIIER